jgi:hypothetical protein
MPISAHRRSGFSRWEAPVNTEATLPKCSTNLRQRPGPRAGVNDNASQRHGVRGGRRDSYGHNPPSLTELEAAGVPPAAAQSIALGKSLELANEEIVRAASVGAQVVTLDAPSYPQRLKQIYDPRSCSMSAEMWQCCRSRGL